MMARDIPSNRTNLIRSLERLEQEYSSGLEWGIRVDKPGLKVGHEFPHSRIWDNGKLTKETLDGTSIISLKGLKKGAKIHGYDGQVYLVAGYLSTYGEDPGEVIVKEAEIMEVPK